MKSLMLGYPPLPVHMGDTIPQEEFEEGDVWSCSVYPSDEYGQGSQQRSVVISADTALSSGSTSAPSCSSTLNTIEVGVDPLNRYSLTHTFQVQSTGSHKVNTPGVDPIQHREHSPRAVAY